VEISMESKNEDPSRHFTLSIYNAFVHAIIADIMNLPNAIRLYMARMRYE
jgi:hypothetical protein